MSSTLEKRLERLEAASGGGVGCPRCVGTMTIVSDAVTGRFHSASWNGEPLDRGEVTERKTERKCPRCGQRIDLSDAVEVKVGGRAEPLRAAEYP